MADEDRKEDKHVEALIGIPKDPASMPAPPPEKKLQMKRLLTIFFLCALMVMLSGCATVPRSAPARVLAGVPAYRIEGTKYVAIAEFCRRKGIDYDWDIVSKQVTLKGNDVKVRLSVGTYFALVNNQPLILDNQVRIYRGNVVVPYSFALKVFGSMVEKKSFSRRREGDNFYRIRKIVIDPGHGGREPGARSRFGLKEKDVVLDIARRLKGELRGNGMDIILTRSSDRFVSLWQRAHIANTKETDLFISIHANASRARQAHGFETYYLSEATDDNARALAAVENASLYFESSSLSGVSTDLKATLWDIVYTENRAQSVELARYISQALEKDVKGRNRGVKSARFYVLKYVRMPSVLVEVGFITNRKEEKELEDRRHRQRVAKAIARGILSYKREYERTDGFTN